MGTFGDDSATVPLDALGLRYVDPFEGAAVRTRQSVRGRSEGNLTRVGEAIAERVMEIPAAIAAIPKRLIEANSVYPPGTGF